MRLVRRLGKVAAPAVLVGVAAVAGGLGYTGLPPWAAVIVAGWLAILTLVVPPIFSEDVTARDHRIVISSLSVALVALPIYHYLLDPRAATKAIPTFRYTIDANGPTAKTVFGGKAAWRYSAPALDTPNPTPAPAGAPVDVICVLKLDNLTWAKIITGRDWIPIVDLKPELPNQRLPPSCRLP